MTDSSGKDGNGLEALRNVDSPEVVRGAFLRFRRRIVILFALAVMIALAPLTVRFVVYLFVREQPGPPADRIVGRVTAISLDGQSVCVMAEGERICGAPRLAAAAQLPTRGESVVAFYVLAPLTPAGDISELVWVAFFTSGSS